MTLLAKRRPRARAVTGTSRPAVLAAIRHREQQLLPVIRRTLQAISRAVPRTDLRHAWVTGGTHPALQHAAAHVWQKAKPAIVAALTAPLRRQDPLEPTSADALAERQVGDLITNLTTRQLETVRGALATLADQGPRESVLGAIGDAVGLTPRQLETVATAVAHQLAEGASEATALGVGQRLAGQLLEQRAKLIARTEAVRYTAALVLERGRAVGGQVVKQWVSARDADVDEICQELDDGEAIPIDEPFRVLGLTFDGPPAHPGCRCVPEIFVLGEGEAV